MMIILGQSPGLNVSWSMANPPLLAFPSNTRRKVALMSTATWYKSHQINFIGKVICSALIGAKKMMIWLEKWKFSPGLAATLVELCLAQTHSTPIAGRRRKIITQNSLSSSYKILPIRDLAYMCQKDVTYWWDVLVLVVILAFADILPEEIIIVVVHPIHLRPIIRNPIIS